MFLITATALAQTSSPPDTAMLHEQLNAQRTARGLRPVQAHAGLDGLAAALLAELVNARRLAPMIGRTTPQAELSQIVANAIGLPEGYDYRHVGLVVTYGVGIERTLNDAFEVQANEPVLYDNIMDLAGIASVEVPAGAPWYAPPVGGVGREVELTGYTLVVILLAGDF